MFKPLALFLGLRYSRARARSGFVSFISVASVLGIALGVMALIMGLSAMNGFEQELRSRVLAVIPHGEVEAVAEPIADWHQAQWQLQKGEGVLAVAPLIRVNGMLEKGNQMKAVQLRAVLPEAETAISDADHYMTGAGLEALKPGENGLILGQQLAKRLGLKLGDGVTLLLPNSDPNLAMKAPLQRRFTLVGLLALGGQLDGMLGFMHLADAQAALGWGDKVQGFSLKVADLMQAQSITFAAANRVPYRLYVRSWMNSQGYLYQDIQMVRTVMYVVMLMVVAVACFNIVSTLVLAVNEKRGDIAILKTMGAGNWQIRLTFMVQGLMNGLAGAIAGAVVGSLLSLYLSDLIALVERLIGHRFLNPDIYFIDFLPSRLHLADVLLVSAVAVLMSLLATLYPAWRASRLAPARELGR